MTSSGRVKGLSRLQGKRVPVAMHTGVTAVWPSALLITGVGSLELVV